MAVDPCPTVLRLRPSPTSSTYLRYSWCELPLVYTSQGLGAPLHVDNSSFMDVVTDAGSSGLESAIVDFGFVEYSPY